MIEWFDDLVLGMRFKSSDKQVTREDIKRFASEFDPQPYHLDEKAAERTSLKGLAASGWHTAAIAMRLAVEVRPFGPVPHHDLIDDAPDYLGLGSNFIQRRKAYQALFAETCSQAFLAKQPFLTAGPFIGDGAWLAQRYEIAGLRPPGPYH